MQCPRNVQTVFGCVVLEAGVESVISRAESREFQYEQPIARSIARSKNMQFLRLLAALFPLTILGAAALPKPIAGEHFMRSEALTPALTHVSLDVAVVGPYLAIHLIIRRLTNINA